MEIREKLKSRIHLNDILEIIFLAQNNNNLKQRLYGLLYDKDEVVSYQTAWILSHFPKKESNWLFEKQSELIDETMRCTHTGKRRILLQILNSQTIFNPLRVDFMDFCLERMVSPNEPVGIQSSCIKIAYKLCRHTPEFLTELKSMLELMEPSLLTPATRSVRKNVLLEINKSVNK